MYDNNNNDKRIYAGILITTNHVSVILCLLMDLPIKKEARVSIDSMTDVRGICLS